MRAKREKIKASQLHGFKYFKVLSGLLERLQDAGCQRERAKRVSAPFRSPCGLSAAQNRNEKADSP